MFVDTDSLIMPRTLIYDNCQARKALIVLAAVSNSTVHLVSNLVMLLSLL